MQLLLSFDQQKTNQNGSFPAKGCRPLDQGDYGGGAGLLSSFFCFYFLIQMDKKKSKLHDSFL